MIRTAKKPSPRAGRGDALAALRDDPAFGAADADTKQWLLALLERGERASSGETETAGASPTAK